jgi:hypothetical protein
VPHADADRRVRADRGRHDGVLEHLAAVHLERRPHLEVVAGAAADERHPAPGDAVRAPHDLLPVARSSSGPSG